MVNAPESFLRSILAVASSALPSSLTGIAGIARSRSPPLEALAMMGFATGGVGWATSGGFGVGTRDGTGVPPGGWVLPGVGGLLVAVPGGCGLPDFGSLAAVGFFAGSF